MTGVHDLTAALRACDPNGTLDHARLAGRLYDRGVRVATPLDDLDVPEWLLPDPGFAFASADDLTVASQLAARVMVLPGCVLPVDHDGCCWYACDVDPRTFYPSNLHELVHDACVAAEDMEKAIGATRILARVPGMADKIGTVVSARETDEGFEITANMDDRYWHSDSEVRFSMTLPDGTLVEGPEPLGYVTDVPDWAGGERVEPGPNCFGRDFRRDGHCVSPVACASARD